MQKVFEKKAKGDILVGLVSGGRPPSLMKGFALMAEKDADIKRIKELVEMMVANDLVEVEIIDGGNKIVLKRPQQAAATPLPVMAPAMPPTAYAVPAAAANTAFAPAQAPTGEENLVDIKSPIVGTFYAAPSPDSEPYVKVGADVNADTVVCIVEAMKVMNEIKAETNGTIAKIMVANGQAVEYGQVLFKVMPH
jgi:acetyl-CoA carboxylase biotin carboxyl carrier protein